MTTESVSIVVTPTDAEWLRTAAGILSGTKIASDAVRKAAGRELWRLAYRAALEIEKGES